MDGCFLLHFCRKNIKKQPFEDNLFEKIVYLRHVILELPTLLNQAL